jgi:hypothetical protein
VARNSVRTGLGCVPGVVWSSGKRFPGAVLSLSGGAHRRRITVAINRPTPKHFRFVFRGTLLGSPETWSFGFHMQRVIDAGSDATLDMIHEDQVTTAVAAFFGTAEISNKVQVDDWRAYQIDETGHMEGNGPLLHTYAVGEQLGASATQQKPPQIAVVVSTLAVDRGPAKRGRFYLPGPTGAVGTDWRMPADQAASYEVQTRTFMKAVANAIDLPGLTSVAGINVSHLPVGSSAGTSQDIDHLEVGRAYDTLRNRRKSLVEDASVGAHIDW